MTKEENFNYWKKRMSDKLVSMSGQMDLDFKEVFSRGKHVDMDLSNLFKVYETIRKGMIEFGLAIHNAKTVEDTKKEEKKEPEQLKLEEEAKVQEVKQQSPSEPDLPIEPVF